MKRNQRFATVTCLTALMLIGCGGHGGGDSLASSVFFATQIGGASTGPFVIYKRDVKQNSPIQITDSAVDCRAPDYSPIKQMYVFLRLEPVTGKWNIYTLKPSDSVPVLHTQTANNHHNPRFSPDGNWIVFSEDQGAGTEVFKVPAEGGVVSETQLTQAGNQNLYPSVSFDNNTVVFASTMQTPNFQLYTLPLAGGATNRVRVDGLNYRYPSFDPSDSKILCSIGDADLTLTTSKSGIAEVSVSGLPPVQITNQIPGIVDAHPRYASNSTTLVFDRTTTPATPNPQVFLKKGATETNLSGAGSILFEQIQSN